MQHLTIQSMMTMHNVPQPDGKLLRYVVSWIVAIATSVIGVAAYAGSGDYTVTLTRPE